MAVVTVASFTDFANLLLAACRLAPDVEPADRATVLAEIAAGDRGLDAALGTSGLAAVAREMARAAEDHARHFTHPGRARDDAIALFWQVAPVAFADPANFAGARGDPDAAAERMVAAVRASPLARDFVAAALPEAFYRGVVRSALRVMIERIGAADGGADPGAPVASVGVPGMIS